MAKALHRTPCATRCLPSFTPRVCHIHAHARPHGGATTAAHASLQAGAAAEPCLDLAGKLGRLRPVEAGRISRLIHQPVGGEVPADVFRLAGGFLEPREDGMGVRAVHVRRGREGEADAVAVDEFGDVIRQVELLAAKLPGREPDDGKAARAVFLVNPNQLFVVAVRGASPRRDVGDERHLACQRGEIELATAQERGLQGVEACRRHCCRRRRRATSVLCSTARTSMLT